MTTATGTRSAEMGRRSRLLHSDKEIVPLGGRGTHLSALAVAIEQRRDDVQFPPTSLIA
jgi:hypothetical protein